MAAVKPSVFLALLVKRAVTAFLALAALSLAGADRAFAVNGLQLIGFSAESTALAGSGHVAIADTSALNTNPAALSLIQSSLRVSVFVQWVWTYVTGQRGARLIVNHHGPATGDAPATGAAVASSSHFRESS